MFLVTPIKYPCDPKRYLCNVFLLVLILFFCQYSLEVCIVNQHGGKFKEHQTGTSPLLELNVGLVSSCILDSMYLIHLGSCRTPYFILNEGTKVH
jgi:hypothetical protein